MEAPFDLRLVPEKWVCLVSSKAKVCFFWFLTVLSVFFGWFSLVFTGLDRVFSKMVHSSKQLGSLGMVNWTPIGLVYRLKLGASAGRYKIGWGILTDPKAADRGSIGSWGHSGCFSRRES